MPTPPVTPSPSYEATVTKMKAGSTQVRAVSQITFAEKNGRCPRKVAGKSLEGRGPWSMLQSWLGSGCVCAIDKVDNIDEAIRRIETR